MRGRRGQLDERGQRGQRDERGQTPHDFALGMGVFLLTLAFVFSMLPTVLAPVADRSATEAARADLVASTALEHLSTPAGSNRLDAGRTASFVAENASGDTLGAFFGLPSGSGVSLTVYNGTTVAHATAADGTRVGLTAGDAPPDGRPSGDAVRLVSFASDIDCRPACRLVVRIW